MSERIVAAALLIDGVTHSIPAPARHHTVMYALDEGYWRDHMGTELSGFVTSEGRFVDRLLARAAGQVTALISPPDLYSEDLW